jgi:hypothetical protein
MKLPQKKKAVGFDPSTVFMLRKLSRRTARSRLRLLSALKGFK